MEESVTILWSSSANTLVPVIDPITNSIIEYLSELDHLTLLVHEDKEDKDVSIDVYDRHPEINDFPYNRLARIIYKSDDVIQILCHTVDTKLQMNNPNIFETIKTLIDKNLQRRKWKRRRI